MNRQDYEVIVVGAGPAGSHTARCLAEKGHDVLLLDRSYEPRAGIICTGIVGTEAFDRLDLPAEPTIDTIDRARFISPAGVEVTYEPERPLAQVVNRTAFDTALSDRAEQAGVTFLRGFEARSLERGPGGLTVAVRNGARYELRSRALVVATGHQRWLHEVSGLGIPQTYLGGVHADLPFTDLDSAELYFGNDIAPGFFAWAVPFGNGTARLGMLARTGARQLFKRFLALEPIRSRLGLDLSNGGRATADRALKSRGIVQGSVTPSYADRVLAVGEAAGQVKTTTAGGIYFGMMGAEIAAKVLSDGLAKDRLDARWLSRYERAWRREFAGEIDSGLELQRAAQGMSDPEIDDLFRALQGNMGAAVRQMVKFDWHGPALRVLFSRSQLLKRARGRLALKEAS